jgi:hypothetical protein
MTIAKDKVEMNRYFLFMEDIIALLEKMEYYQDEMIFRQSTIKDELKYIIRMRSTLIENFTEYDVIEKTEEVYYFLIREGYIYEDLNDAQVKLGKNYFREFGEKKKNKRAFITNLLLGFGLGFFLNV